MTKDTATNENPQTIIRFEASNIKRLRAVEINPKGNLVVIGGNNEQGKSSVLDAIAMALGGRSRVPERPLRDGASKGHVILETEELVVERTFAAAGGTNLTVRSKDDRKLTSPQAILDSLTSSVCFDPMEFLRQKPGEQASVLRAIAGLDTRGMDAERAKIYEDRTLVNRETERLKVQASELTVHDDVPEEKVVVSELLQRIEKAREHNSRGKKLAEDIAAAETRVGECEKEADEILKNIQELQAKLEAKQTLVKETKAGIRERKAERESFTAIDTEPMLRELNEAESVNAKIALNEKAAAARREMQSKMAESKELTRRIEDIDTRKMAMMESAAFPVEGLGFAAEGAYGITYNGIPFEQASSAQRLRVSMAVALSLNPRLKVCLIRDGSLLDDTSLETVASMAREAGASVWIERVGDGKEVSVVIEDGAVKETR